MTDKEQIKAIIKQYADKGARLFLEASESNESYAESYWDGYKDCADGLQRELDDMQEEPATSVWHDSKDTPVASKTKIVLYTNGKWDMFKSYETKDDYDNYWAGVNQALEEKGVLVKKWAYVEDLLKL